MQPEEQKEEKDYQHRPRQVAFFLHGQKMKYRNSQSLKSNYDFQTVYRKGKSYANKYLVMYVLENNEGMNRLGISVSKK